MPKRENPWAGTEWSPHQVKFHVSLKEVTVSKQFTQCHYDNTVNQIMEGSKKFYKNMDTMGPQEQKEEESSDEKPESSSSKTTSKSQSSIKDFFSRWPPHILTKGAANQCFKHPEVFFTFGLIDDDQLYNNHDWCIQPKVVADYIPFFIFRSCFLLLSSFCLQRCAFQVVAASVAAVKHFSWTKKNS